MMRMRSHRLFLLLLLVVTIPALLFGTGSSRADDKEGKGDNENEGQNQREGKNDRAVRLFRTVAIPPTEANTTATTIRPTAGATPSRERHSSSGRHPTQRSTRRTFALRPT